MKNRNILLVALLPLCVACAQEQWVDLFNGTDLEGWTKLGGEATYAAVDGVIVGTPHAGGPSTFLATDEEYSDFILEFDFWMDDGINSGVQLRSHSDPEYRNGVTFGYQFEMDPSPRAWTGGIYDESRRNWLYNLRGYDLGRSAYKNTEWNSVRIEAYGNSIRTWVNGIPTANLWDDMDESGFIALQVHNTKNPEDEAKAIKWRNLRICTKDIEKFLTPESEAAPEKNSCLNALSPREEKEGWKLLWDGETTEGWRGAKLDSFPQTGWTIEDGLLKVNAAEGLESANGGDIVTVGEYENFILSAEFKFTAGANSGIKYFVDTDTNKGEGSAIGCEFQILDDDLHPDAKLGVDGNRTIGSLYDLIPAPATKSVYGVKSVEFNVATIVVQGKHVEHWLNGEKMLEYERDNQEWNALVAYSKYRNWPDFGNAAKGHILLQDHGDAVSFRNIKIKEL